LRCYVKSNTGLGLTGCVSRGGMEHPSHQVLMNILRLISDLFSSIKIKKLKPVLARISLIVHIVIYDMIWHLYFHTKSIHNYKYMLFHGDVHLTIIKYINIGKTKLHVLIKICTCNIWIYEMGDINSLRDCALDIWTGMLFHKIAPL
jgi:hypothetical protein